MKKIKQKEDKNYNEIKNVRKNILSKAGSAINLKKGNISNYEKNYCKNKNINEENIYNKKEINSEYIKKTNQKYYINNNKKEKEKEKNNIIETNYKNINIPNNIKINYDENIKRRYNKGVNNKINSSYSNNNLIVKSPKTFNKDNNICLSEFTNNKNNSNLNSIIYHLNKRNCNKNAYNNFNKDIPYIINKENFNKFSTIFSNRNNFKNNLDEFSINIKNIIENSKNNEKMKKNSYIYSRHYGDRNKCPLCQSRDMKDEYSEKKMGLYKKHICKERIRHYHNVKISSKLSNLKNNFIQFEEKNDNIFQIKRELSPKNIFFNKGNYSINEMKNEFLSNILKSRLKKGHKIGIIHYPVLNNYFNS